jgi:hypothetical protein
LRSGVIGMIPFAGCGAGCSGGARLRLRKPLASPVTDIQWML